ncbi:hypothetical protein GBAR_LOCUS22547 [Geodia barretti]|uniref:SH3 domain-containing protein n=1 Tax=Geodia barretti TaxID=519541 RepID=A0AA35X5J2_GEOBA|nr:hypothetical protein GBAR_LOCUS22547 [Geodia barretti]
MTEQLRAVSLLLVALLPVFCRGDLSAAVQVGREGVSGSVNFTQEHEGSGVTVSLQLDGIGSEIVQLAIHSLPFPPSSPNPCQLVGPVFRDVGTANTQGSMNCTNISLYGRESIVGRSLMITAINNSLSIYICANIRPPTNSMVLWAPFRSNNVTNGNVFLWKQTVYVSLVTETSSSELPWAILSPTSECAIAPGNIYNPDGVSGECSSDNVSGCMEGDLGGKNGCLSVENGSVRAVVNDPGLDISGVEGLILAVGTQCATIQTFPSLRVVGVAGEGGVVLTQSSPLDATEVNLTGSNGLTLEINTLPPRTECSSTEGIFDPRGAGSPSQGSTLDFYPFGNLTGKAGGRVVYSDPFLPLTGDDSVVGRSLVVKRTDGSISGCGILQYDDYIIEIRADLAIEGFSGIVVFSQRASDPFSQTIITVETNISADIEVFTPTPMRTSLEATPTTTFLIATTNVLSTPSPTPSSLSPSLLLPYETSSVVLATSPFPLLSSSPFPLLSSSPVLFLMPDTFTPVSTVAPGQQRRRRRETGEYNWSLRQRSGGVSGEPEDCAQLPIIGSSSEGCSRSSPLSCASGDLSTKHGPLSPGPMPAIFHDPFLPLSGPQSVGSAVLFLEPANGVGESACVLVTMVTSATPTPTPMLSSVELRTSSQSRSSVATSTLPSSSVVATTIPPTRQQTGDDVDIVLIGAIVGGVVAAALVLTVLVLCLCLCIRRLRSGRVDLNKQDKKNGRDVELGHYQQKPQIGSDHYRAVSSYHPQTSDSGDLALEEGEWVTLLEAPPGGQWWRGQTAAGEGWFPKSHVQLVDREAEHRKAEEGELVISSSSGFVSER